MVNRMIGNGICIGMICLVIGCSSLGGQPANTQPPVEQKTQIDLDAQAQAVEQLHVMIQSKAAYSTEEIMPLFDQLDAVDTKFMLGTWKGGKFDAGKSPDPINWYGKRFNSEAFVEPLLARKPDGTVYSFNKWGVAQMREIKFREKVSASLIYDQKPIIDYFRKIDDNTLLGVGETKGNISFFFHLTRENIVAEK